MKRLTLFVTALLACAITAQAKINETRDQLIKRFGRNQIIKQTANSIAFKKGENMVTATLRNGVCVYSKWRSLEQRLGPLAKTTKGIVRLGEGVWLLPRDQGMTFAAECIAMARAPEGRGTVSVRG